MTEWWTSLDLFMKILWCIAIASSLIFIIETVLTFIGADVEMDMDTDFDIADGGFEGDPSMNLYTFRNLVNFLLGMSWTAILLNEQMKSKALLMLIAFAVGAAIVFAVMMMFKGLSKMQQSGNVDVRVLKDILGHEQLNTTQIYTHVSVERLKDEFAKAHPRA